MNFKELNISPRACETLSRRGIREATPVQERAIPVIRAGRELIAQAKTGTGKTLAFLLPIMEKIKPEGKAAQALVISPTRELALQTAKVASYLGPAYGVNSLVIFGGQDIERQKEKLRRSPQLIVGTPGRILDHLRRGTLDLSHVNKVVLDEADEMLKLGFIEDVETILERTASDRRLMLFSATMPERVKALALRYMKEPENIEIKDGQVTLAAIEQTIIDATEETKLDKLCEVINREQPYLMMVFCHTKARTHALTMALAARGYLVDELHGDLTQVQRALVLKRFASAKLQILCATDIAARGLDIEGVTHVVSYDIPHDSDTYVHRIGRTGRAGATGRAITLVTARQYDLLRRIEAGLKERIKKERSERGERRKAREEKIIRELKKKREEHKKAAVPKSKYAKGKQKAHGGRNDRSRREKPSKSKSNLGHRSKMGRH